MIVVQVGLTDLINPTLMSVLNKWIGFRKTIDVLSLEAAVFFVVLLVLTAPDLKNRKRSFKSQRKSEENEEEEVLL